MAQIGTLGLETENNGTVKVPVFDTGDSGTDVYEMVRVQTASGVGFIPVISNTSDAAFPYLRVQTQNYGVCAVHNEASLFEQYIYYMAGGDSKQYDLSLNQTQSNADSFGTLEDSAVSDDGSIFMADRDTLYKYPEDLSTQTTASSFDNIRGVAVDPNKSYVFTYEASLSTADVYRRDYNDLTSDASVNVSGDNAFSPIGSDSSDIYVKDANDNLTAVNYNMSIDWTGATISGNSVTPISVGDSYLFAETSDDNGTLGKYSKSDGSLLGSVNLDDTSSSRIYDIFNDKDYVYAGVGNGAFYKVDKSDMSTVWGSGTQNGSNTTNIDHIVASIDGFVYISFGQYVEKYDSTGSFVSSINPSSDAEVFNIKPEEYGTFPSYYE